MIIVVRRIHLNWDTSLPSFPMSWDSLWVLPSCNTLLLWCASAFVVRKGLSSSGINGKKKGEQPVSTPSVSHLLKKLDRNMVEGDCIVIFVKQGTT